MNLHKIKPRSRFADILDQPPIQWPTEGIYININWDDWARWSVPVNRPTINDLRRAYNISAASGDTITIMGEERVIT